MSSVIFTCEKLSGANEQELNLPTELSSFYNLSLILALLFNLTFNKVLQHDLGNTVCFR